MVQQLADITATYSIIPYEASYRDDTIFCLLSAKDALGRVPRLNEDLLDIKINYLDKGEMFLLALDERKRVMGMLGTKSFSVIHTRFADDYVEALHFYTAPNFIENDRSDGLRQFTRNF